MARIRKVEIKHFRGIKQLEWQPSPGINCLIGPGDSGKSTILDAIDFCLGARRFVSLTDADFYNLDVSKPISITLTLGDLDDALKSIDTYGNYLRGFDPATGNLEDEPEKELETVLSLSLRVGSDLEPVWTLLSDRVSDEKEGRNLAWKDRIRLAPTRIGALTDYNLSWQRNSVLNRISEERVDTSAAMAEATRNARIAFGGEASEQLQETLSVVATTAKELGIPVGKEVKALLDANSISINGGTLALHNEQGVPLRGLGIGSTRLLIAGLQRQAAQSTSIILVDEIEYGLEPHRISRFLNSLGSKESQPPLQAFLTTHSPVVLRELGSKQLFVVRTQEDSHVILPVPDSIQGTVRTYPEAFLARKIVVCEGATEVGLLRGIDQFYIANGEASLFASGTALVDADGVSNLYPRASAFIDLGYSVAALRDDDAKPKPEDEKAFVDKNGFLTMWSSGCSLEDELFKSLSDCSVIGLLRWAIECYGEELVEQHIKTVSGNRSSIYTILEEEEVLRLSEASRKVLALASQTKKNGWFKSISKMETAALDIVAPGIAQANPEFRARIENIFLWIHNV